MNQLAVVQKAEIAAQRPGEYRAWFDRSGGRRGSTPLSGIFRGTDNHASTRTTQLYDRRCEELSLDEVERIRV